MCDLSECGASGEATREFKVEDTKKYIIILKRKGDGYLIDCIYDGGFIYTSFFLKTPSTNKWCDKCFIPTQPIVLFFPA